MITVRLKGGLGNQLFQYAAARALAVRHHTEVAFDLSYLTRSASVRETFREYALDAFGIIPVPPPLPEKIAFGMIRIAPGKIIQKTLQKALSAVRYNESSSFDPNLEQRTSPRTYLNGYFLSEKYFRSVEPQLRTELRFRSSLSTPLAQKIQSTSAVSLHVRRGDYVTNPETHKLHGLCSLAYYQSAVAYLAERQPDIYLFVFSDDIAWARAHLVFPHPVHFVDENKQDKPYLDMQLMSMCRHHIIANSSFSWWGAWLNPSPHKIVIAPEHWVADTALQAQTRDILPNGWVKIPT